MFLRALSISYLYIHALFDMKLRIGILDSKEFTVMPRYVQVAGFVVVICALTYALLRLLIPAPHPAPRNDPGRPHSQPAPSSRMLYGLTIDDSWDDTKALSDIVEALQRLPARPTVRIVMSNDRSPQSYHELFKAIHRVADIMAQPVDSSSMQRYSVERYQQRFAESYHHLSQYVTIWEIGNEINGQEWIKENPHLTAAKVASAYRYIRDKHGLTALVPYYFPPGESTLSMRDWLRTYLPDDLKQGLDYVLVSYYEDDNDGYQPNWRQVFTELETLFSRAKLGIGECGTPSEHAPMARKLQLFQHYYSMPQYTPRYVGGYFWWYWAHDGVPYRDNPLWEETYKYMKKRER